LGKAGDAFISEREFLERFELTPGLYRHRKPQLEEEKEAFLYSMIAERLLAQEALSRKLDQDTVFQQWMLEITKMVSRDELYREEVREKVAVSNKDIAEGSKRALKQLLLRYIFFTREEDALFVRGQIKNGGDFEAISIDSSMNALRDTATVIWGDADTTIEEAAYRLSVGEVSPVINAGGGWYIIKLAYSNTNEYYSIMQPQVLSERVAIRIRARRERKRVAEFSKGLLAGTNGYSSPEAFKKFSEGLSSVFARHITGERSAVTENMVSELSDSLAGELNDTLIVAGSRIWKVREVIYALYMKGFEIKAGQLAGLNKKLYNEFRGWVEQELLSQEALRRGLDRLPEVEKILEPWRQQNLAVMMRRYINRSITVSEGEIYAHLKSADTSFTIPQVNIRLLRTLSTEDMRGAVLELESGAPFQKVAEKWSADPESRKRGCETGFFPVTERPPLGEIAWQMEEGQIYGPLFDSAGATMFELLGKKKVSFSSDTALSSRLSAGKSELLRMKQKRKLNLFLAQAGQKRGFSIFQERLGKLQVSNVPMLAFRLLGFGGRMFAAPFVEKNLEWLQVEPPEGLIFP